MAETPAVVEPEPEGAGPQPESAAVDAAPGGGFGLPVAIALIMGSIIIWYSRNTGHSFLCIGHHSS
jgi:hypothetical protein